MRLPQRAIHLDCHTMPAIDDVGADFDAADFAATLTEARVDFITVFAKCNLGMAYYPTNVGVTHPSLQCDMLGEMIEACHRRDIAVAAYFNAGIDHQTALQHRDWAVLSELGQACTEDRLDSFCRNMCFGGPWSDHLEAMIQEVLTGYEVDGVFLDCWAWRQPCYGHECLRAMKDAGRDPLDPDAVLEAHQDRKMLLIRRVRRMIDESRPDATYFLNGVPYHLQLPMASHLEIESLPGGGWGYMDFPWKVRALRSTGAHLVRQTGRFHHSWGDFGGLRTQAALDCECFQTVAHAVACGVGDHLHPRGQLPQPVYQRIGSIYQRIEALEPWTRHARPLTDTAVVVDGLASMGVDMAEGHALVGATRMLEELRVQFDIIGPETTFDPYALLVLLEPLRLDGPLSARIERHLQRGGAVLSAGAAGLLADREQFSAAWPVDYMGPCDLDPAFFHVCDSTAGAVPDMPITIRSAAVQVKQRDNADKVADLVRPYFNFHWDGFHGHVYVPPDKAYDEVAAASNQQVAHVAFSVFDDYGRRADPSHRHLVKSLLGRIAPSPLVIGDDLPSFARVTLTEQTGRTIVHVLSYLPERRAQDQDVIEEPIELHDVQLNVKHAAPSRVCLAPQQTDLAFEQTDGRIRFQVPKIVGYQMIVVEHE